MNDPFVKLDNNKKTNLLNLDNKKGLSLGNEVNLKSKNVVRARLDKEIRSALDKKAIKVIKNRKMTGNTDVTIVKIFNPTDFLVNIVIDTTNLLISD